MSAKVLDLWGELVRVVKNPKKVLSASRHEDLHPMKLDTGADEHISSDSSILSVVYPSDYRADLSLRSATGHDLNIVQVGRVNELIDDVFITDAHDAVGGT